ncbi:hypothetical protein D3C72_678920 [compost metagenome]
MRAHLQADTDVLTLDCGKGVLRTTTGGNVGAGLERHVLAYQDLRLLVVQGQQARRRQQVAAAIAGQGRNQRGKTVRANGQGDAPRQLGFLAQQVGQGSTTFAEGNAAFEATFVDAPLQAQRFIDTATDFDDCRMDQHLRPGLVQLLDDLLHAAQRLRLAHYHQGVLAGIGLDHGLAGEVRAQSLGARRTIEPLAHLTQYFGKLLGTAVLQAHHPPVLRSGRNRYIQRAGQLRKTLPGLDRAQDQKTVAVHVSQYANAAVRATGGGFDHREHNLGLGFAQGHQFMIMPLATVELQDQVFQAVQVGCGVGDHQGVGGAGRSNVAIAGNQRPQQAGQIGSDTARQVENPCGDRCRYGLHLLVCPGLGFACRQHQQAVAVVHGGKALGIEHRVEQPPYPFAIERLVRKDGDAPLHARVENDRLVKDRPHLTHHVAHVGIAHRQLPGGCLSKRQGAGKGK